MNFKMTVPPGALKNSGPRRASRPSMNRKMTAPLAALAVLLAASPAAAQVSAAAAATDGSAKGNTPDSLAGRAILGYLPTSSGSGIQPIIGIAGASRVAAEIDFGLALRRVAIAPGRAMALGIRADSGQVVRLSLDGDADAAPVDVPANPDRILFSPAGGVAGFYDRTARSLLLVDDVAGSASRGESFSLDVSGLVAGIAIADVGGVAVAVFSSEEGAAVYALSKAGAGARLLTRVRSAADLRFVPHTTDVLLTDLVASQVLLITDVDGAPSVRVIASAENGVEGPTAAVSQDGQRVLIAAGGGIASLELESGEVTSIPCRCSPSGFEPVGSNGRYHVTSGRSGAIALLDERINPSIILVPARDAPSLSAERIRVTGRGRAR